MAGRTTRPTFSRSHRPVAWRRGSATTWGRRSSRTWTTSKRRRLYRGLPLDIFITLALIEERKISLQVMRC